MTIEQALRYILTPDGLKTVIEIILGIGLSFAVDWVPGFTEISARLKRVYMLAGCLLLPGLAVYGLSMVLGAPQPLDTYFGAVVMGGMVFLGSQAAHVERLDPRNKAQIRIDEGALSERH